MSGLIVEKTGRVAILRFDEPESMNALSHSIKQALAESVPSLMADPEIGCLLPTGSGRAFCAGGDLRSMDDRRPAAVRERMSATRSFVLPLIEGEKPVVAAVNGAAVGAGLAIAMLADIVVASE